MKRIMNIFNIIDDVKNVKTEIILKQQNVYDILNRKFIKKES